MDAYQLAEHYARFTSRPLFITGKAGSGKTTFLRNLYNTTDKNIAIVAPTGVAAINAGGVTIHSFFQLPTHVFPPTPEAYNMLFAEQASHLRTERRHLFQRLELLVIDEISMVRADLLDAIDAVLRHYRRRPSLPFGGVQVIFIGDLYQLAPVMKGGAEQGTLEKYYAGPYFFHSKVMQQITPIYIEFDHIFRQQDEQFVKLLNEVRENRLTQQGWKLLMSRYLPEYKNSEKDFHITLTTHNKTADDINEQQINGLKGKAIQFKASVNGKFDEKSFPTDEILKIKKGARVMFVKNDSNHLYYNGKLGIITGYDTEQQTITVTCDDCEIEVEPQKWENISFSEDPTTGEITQKTLGSFTQFPVRLAWAITIHKSQGLTFDKVIIDAGRSFASGQVYVALSRCRTLEGIVLTSSLYNAHMQQDYDIINYTLSQPDIETIGKMLPDAKREYLLKVLYDTFDLRSVNQQIGTLMSMVKRKKSFSPDSENFLYNLSEITAQLAPIGEKFQSELFRIITSSDEYTERLKSRISAAADYFSPKLRSIAADISAMPCRCKNKEDAEDFIRYATEIHTTLWQKISIMKQMSLTPDTDAYAKAKKNARIPDMAVHSIYIKTRNEGKTENKKRKNMKKNM